MSDKPNVSTPEPVLKAAATVGAVATVVTSFVGAAIALGILSSQEAASVSAIVEYVSANVIPVGTAVVGIVGVVSGLVSSLVTAFAARSKVVPVDSDVYSVVKTDVVR